MYVTVEIASAVLQILRWLGWMEEANPVDAGVILARLRQVYAELPITDLLQTPFATDHLMRCKILLLCALLAFELDLYLFDADDTGAQAVSIYDFFHRRSEFTTILADCGRHGPFYLVLHNERVGWATAGLSRALILFYD